MDKRLKEAVGRVVEGLDQRFSMVHETGGETFRVVRLADVKTALEALADVLQPDEQPDPEDPFYYWTVRFGVHPRWIADGFQLTDERALEMLSNTLDYAYVDRELAAKVVAAPDPAAIRAEQHGEARVVLSDGKETRYEPRMCECGEMLTGQGCGCESEPEEE